MNEERDSLEARLEVLISEIEDVNRSLNWIGFFVFLSLARVRAYPGAPVALGSGAGKVSLPDRRRFIRHCCPSIVAPIFLCVEGRSEDN
jgi:hypothetical protein